MLTYVSFLDMCYSMLLCWYLYWFAFKESKSARERQARKCRPQLFLPGLVPQPDSLISTTPDRAPATTASAEAVEYRLAARRRWPAQAQMLDQPPARPIPGDGPRTARVTSFTPRRPFPDTIG